MRVSNRSKCDGGSQGTWRYRPTLDNAVNDRAAVSPEMAIRRAKAFGGTPDTWVRMQANHDLARALKNESRIQVKRYEPKSAA
jgi:plasmid maintenance system antidote protein VapI